MKRLLLTALLFMLVPGNALAASDRTAPRIRFDDHKILVMNAEVMVGGLSRITGKATDNRTGIASVEVSAIKCTTWSDNSCSYTGVTGWHTDLDPVFVTCSSGRRRSCTWAAYAPLEPGHYWVMAEGRDRAGNHGYAPGFFPILVV